MRIICLFITVIFMIYMAILGFSKNQDVAWLAPLQNDKQLHFTMFLILTILIYLTINQPPIKNAIITTVGMASLCFGSEIAQDLISERVFDIWDIVWNLIGSLTGLIIAILIDVAKRRIRGNLTIESEIKTREVSQIV